LTSQSGDEYNANVRERGFLAARTRDFLADAMVDFERVRMALSILSALQIKHAKPGILFDGGGLQIRVGEASVRTVLRYTSPGGERRELGLGAMDRTSTQAAGRSLAEARRRAQEARNLLDRGLDPIEERKAQRSAAKEAEAAKRTEARRGQVTLARVAREYHERVIEHTRTPKHSAQWIASLENNVPEHLWHAPISNVTAPLLLDAIAEVAQRVPETASRMRQRLEAVFDDAEFRSIREGNPARASAKAGRSDKGPASRRSLCCSALRESAEPGQ
jgi:hypothetical protein